MQVTLFGLFWEGETDFDRIWFILGIFLLKSTKIYWNLYCTYVDVEMGYTNMYLDFPDTYLDIQTVFAIQVGGDP